MAMYECIVSGDLDAFLAFVEDDIRRTSAQAVFLRIDTMGGDSFLGRARNAFQRWEASLHS